MINRINFKVKELEQLSQYPKDLYYIGNLELLKRKKIAVVGSRHPTQYAINLTQRVVSLLSQARNVIVSGGAIGIDTTAHKSAGADNTIMISGTGLDIRYPAINKKMIANIEQDGLVVSQFSANTPSLRRNFAIRNEIIVALCDILIVAYADLKSGSMRSVEYALKMNKKIFVFPHRYGESDGTNQLLATNQAKAIYDIDEFVSQFGYISKELIKDDFLEYCKSTPPYSEAIFKYGDKVFEYELLGKIQIQNGKVVAK